jgi:hypothetical protein
MLLFPQLIEIKVFVFKIKIKSVKSTLIIISIKFSSKYFCFLKFFLIQNSFMSRIWSPLLTGQVWTQKDQDWAVNEVNKDW